MIGWFVDAWSQSLCRSVYNLFGGFPTSCTVNGGRPFFYLVVALAFVAFAVGLIFWRRRSGKVSS